MHDTEAIYGLRPVLQTPSWNAPHHFIQRCQAPGNQGERRWPTGTFGNSLLFSKPKASC